MPVYTAIQNLKLLLLLLPLASTPGTLAQDSLYSRYGLATVDFSTYQQQAMDNPDHELVDLSEYIPSIMLDIRYATTENFMHKPMYDLPKAYLRKAAADSLRLVQRALNKMGMGLKVYDAYRPYSVTVAFYENYPDTTFVASPYSGSRHNRGCAVDLTVIELRSGEEIMMPTGYDDFSDKAHSNYRKLPGRAIRNRKLLQQLMTAHGFTIYPAEWWHFDFRGWQQFPVLDIPFRQLGK